MRYSCDDIKRILASGWETTIDQDAFLEHIATCSACADFGNIGPGPEAVLKSLRPGAAPMSISRNVMKSIRSEANLPAKDMLNRMTQIVIPIIGFIVIAITAVFNFNPIRMGLGKAAAELAAIWDYFGEIDIEWHYLFSYADKVALTPLLLAIMITGSLLIWMLCLIRFKEIIK
jgi:hypothetical protein